MDRLKVIKIVGAVVVLLLALPSMTVGKPELPPDVKLGVQMWEEFIPRDKAIAVLEGDYRTWHWAWGRCRFSLSKHEGKLVKSVEFKTPMIEE